MIKITGDLIKLACNGEFDVIVHGCNCFNTMGAGIALQIKNTFPQEYEIDQSTTRGDKNKLGRFSYVTCVLPLADSLHNLIVINAYTQYTFRTGNEIKCLLDYDALQSVFRTIKKQFHGLRIGYPKIGCDLAGGDWDIVSKIIDDELAGENHTFVEYCK